MGIYQWFLMAFGERPGRSLAIPKFSKVSALVYLLYNTTMELYFWKICTDLCPFRTQLCHRRKHHAIFLLASEHNLVSEEQPPTHEKDGLMFVAVAQMS